MHAERTRSVDSLGREITAAERALLKLTGFFPWGKDAWINEDDLGWVMDTADALEQAVDRSRG